MADFNADIKVREPGSFLNYSRGVDTNTQGDSTLGKLFQNAGDLITTGTKVAVQSIEDTITNRLTAGIDKVREEFGVDGATTMQENASKSVLPGAIDRAGKQLDVLNQAVRQGNLSESHYQARVNSVARQLRQQFPAFREHIDQTISRLNGTDPANATRKALMAEAQDAADRASRKEDKYQAFIEWGIKQGHLSPTEQAMARSGKMTQEEVYAAITQSAYTDEKFKREQANLALRKSRGEDTSRVAGEVLDGTTQDILDKSTNGALSAFGKTSKDMDAFVQKVQTGNLTPEDTSAWTNHLNSAKADAHRRLNLAIEQANNNGVTFKQDQLKQARERIDSHYQGFLDAATNKDWGMLGQWKRSYEAKLENAKLGFIEPEFNRRAAAFKAVMGENAYLQTQTNATVLSAANNHSKAFLLNGLATGSYRSLQEAIQEGKGLAQTQADANKTATQTIKEASAMLADPKTPVAVSENIAKSFFSDANASMLGATTASNRADAYEMLTNPAIGKRMSDLKAQGREDIWNQYKRWTEQGRVTYGMTPVTDVANYTKDRPFNVNFQPETGTFVVSKDPARTQKGNLRGAADAADEAIVQDAAKRLGKYVAPIISIAKAEGRDPTADIATYLRLGGVDPASVGVVLSTGKGPMKAGASGLTPQDLAINPNDATGVGIDTTPLTAAEKQKMQQEEAQIRNNEIRSGRADFSKLWEGIYGKIKDTPNPGDYNSLPPEVRKEIELLFRK